jgi:hypothetical protein
MADNAHGQQINGYRAQSGQGRNASMGQVSNPDYKQQYPQQQHR